MKRLLSLPPNLVNCFHEITGYSRDEWFCTSDPVGCKLGSGGGSTWLLEACYREHGDGMTFDEAAASCRRTEPPTACLRAVGQGADAHSRVQMGARTAPFARSTVAAGASLRADNEPDAGQHAHDDCERRRLHTRHSAPAAHSRGRCRVLRTVAWPRNSQGSRGVRVQERHSFGA